MTDFLAVVAGVLFVSALILFLGGMAAAAGEHLADRRAGKPLTFPGWKRKDRDALGLERDRYKVPGRTGWVVWPLVFVGLPGIAGKYLDWRARRHGVAS